MLLCERPLVLLEQHEELLRAEGQLGLLSLPIGLLLGGLLCLLAGHCRSQRW